MSDWKWELPWKVDERDRVRLVVADDDSIIPLNAGGAWERDVVMVVADDRGDDIFVFAADRWDAERLVAEHNAGVSNE